MRRLALLLMALASFWIGAPLCAHAAPQPMPMPMPGAHPSSMASHHHHDGLAGCAGCVMVAVVPDVPDVIAKRATIASATPDHIRGLDGIGYAATTPPPRLRA